MNDNRIQRMVYEWELEGRRRRGQQAFLGNTSDYEELDITREDALETDGELSSIGKRI